MKKFFVLYSLRQRLPPSIYKTKTIVTKHIKTNNNLNYLQFDNQQHAKIFVNKFISTQKNKQSKTLSQQDVNQLKDSIVGIKKQQQKVNIINNNNNNNNNNNHNLASQSRLNTHHFNNTSSSPIINFINNKRQQLMRGSMNNNMRKQAQWTVLPNGHALRINPNVKPIKQQTIVIKTQPVVKEQVKDNKNHDIKQESNTKQNNQQIYNINNDSNNQKLSYWLVWNTKQLQVIKAGKKKSQLGLLLIQLQKNNTKQWVKQNIIVKRYRTKKQALNKVQQLKQQKHMLMNRLKGEKIRQTVININNISSVEANIESNDNINKKLVNQQGQVNKITDNMIKSSDKIEQQEQQKQVGANQIINPQQQQQRIQPIVLNYEDINQVDYNLQINQSKTFIKQQNQQSIKINNNQQQKYRRRSKYYGQTNKQQKQINKKQKQIRKKVSEQKILWATQLIRQSQQVQDNTIQTIQQNGDIININQINQININDKEVLGQQKMQKIDVVADNKQKEVKQQKLQHTQQQKYQPQPIVIVQTKSEQVIQQDFKRQQITQRVVQQKNHQQRDIKNHDDLVSKSSLQLQAQTNKQALIIQKEQQHKQKQKQITTQQQKTLQPIQQPITQPNNYQQKLQTGINKTTIITIQQKKQSTQPQQQIQYQPQQQSKLNNQTIQQKSAREIKIKPHPFNKQYIKNFILSSSNLSLQQSHQQQQSHSIEQQQQLKQHQHQYSIYPSLLIRQSPGLAIASYQIKSNKTNKIIKSQSLTLGQYKKQQANLLALAFTLSSTAKYFMNNNNTNFNNNNNTNFNNSYNNKIKLHLNKQMHTSLNYNYKLDKKMKQTQQFTRSLQQQYQQRIEYIL